MIINAFHQIGVKCVVSEHPLVVNYTIKDNSIVTHQHL
jgi:hypothetical protein